MQPLQDRLVDEQFVSEITGVKVRTLRKWRLQGRGPKVKRLEGRLVRYSLLDLQDWLRGQPHLKREDATKDRRRADGDRA